MSFSVLVDPEAAQEEVAQTDPEKQEQTPELQSAENLPEKFKGKTAKDIADAYSNLESELGRSRNEIGTQRRLLDELLGLRRAGEAQEKSQTVTHQPITADSLYADPEKAITERAKSIADERVNQEAQRISALENELATERFRKKHPNFETTVQSKEFTDWMQGSPYRVGLVKKAANGDWDAADEALNLYVVGKPPASNEPSKTEAAKQASLAKSGGSNAAGVVKSSGDGKTIYRRSELASLYINNPEEYNRRFETEFAQAYKEKRVR